MKLILIALSVAHVCLVSANNADVGIVLFSDVFEHATGYYLYIMTGGIDIPNTLLSYFNIVKTYTDDSYTSYLSDFPVNSEMLSLIENLKWFSSRLESDISVALTENYITTITGATGSLTESAAPSTSTSIHNLFNSTFSLTLTESLSFHPPSYAYNSTIILGTSSTDNSSSSDGAYSSELDATYSTNAGSRGVIIGLNLFVLGVLSVLLV